MKTCLFALVTFASCSASGGVSTSLRSTREDNADVTSIKPVEAFGLTGDLPRNALLEISQENDAKTENRVLFAKLRSQERVAMQERRALQAQQKVLTALEQQQLSFETRVAALESNGAALDSQRLVVEKGTLRGNGNMHGHKVSRGRKNITITETEEQFWERKNKDFYEHAVGIFFYMLTTLIVGFIYLQLIEKSVGPMLPESMIRTDEFQYGAFECGDLGLDWYICLCSWCCEWVRWADTASHPQIDFLAFWPALFITSLLAATATITYGITVPILLLIVVFCRQRIRIAHGLPSGTFSVLAWDCCLWICCPCCAIVQEARQIEYVESRLVPYYEDRADGSAGSYNQNPYATTKAGPYDP